MSQNISSRLLLSNVNLKPQRQQDSRQRSAHSRNSNHSENDHSTIYNQNIRPVSRNKSKRNSVSSGDYHCASSFNHQAKLENTYSLGPQNNQKFSRSKVGDVVENILKNCLMDTKYEPNKCKKLVQEVSEEIKRNVKSMVYMRYKIVVNLTIGQNRSNENSLIMASRALWNTDTDNECTVHFKNESLYATATIFAVYFD